MKLQAFFHSAPPPLCAAAVWALSPLQTSAVTYLVQRMASIQALFFTLSVACFIKARLLSGDKKRSAIFFFFLCALSSLCSFLSKENSAVLPVALAITDIWFFDSAWLKKAWALCRKTGWKVRAATAAALLSSSFYAFAVVLPELLSGYAKRDFNLIERLLTEGRAVVWYMSLLLWPNPARLSMDHEVEISTSLLSPLTTLPSLLVIGALIFLAIRFRRRFPVITFGIAWFFLNLVIESTIIPLELVFEHRLYLPSIGFYLSITAILVTVFRQAARRLPEAEFAKAACSSLLIVAACLTLLTFSRNGAWEDPVTIHYDAVAKAPNSPRANSDFANVLCTVDRYEDAIKYAERSIELGRKGRETDALAQNAITIALIKLGRIDEAIERDEEFLKDKVNGLDGGPLPNLCLNLAQACIIAKKPEEAYRWTLEALKYVQLTDNSFYKKGLVEMTARAILAEFGPQGLDPNHDGILDPGDLPPGLWVAKEFKKHGEAQYAREIIEREYANDPGDPHLKTEMENLQKEDAQNSAQKEKWNSFQKYVRNPFSRFNFDMVVAFLVQQKHLPKVFQALGENRLDAALQIFPGSRDARLLKGWYNYARGDGDHAVEAARKVLKGDPEDSNAWLALGFFSSEAGDTEGAIAAFEKVIELYPGYQKRTLVEDFCKQLRAGRSIASASNRQ
ncbi:Tetratricopeptide TPR_2 repeat protein [Syntrophobacter sp. SbD1]|nr:Tetratricopeptide TPR_2 repeat protein [Syntrophobacter sp. SbD1]